MCSLEGISFIKPFKVVRRLIFFTPSKIKSILKNKNLNLKGREIRENMGLLT